MLSFTEKLHQLRQLLAEQKCDGVIVPNTDEFQGEYIPASAKRLEWLTGFSGSAGTVVILKDKAAFFTDGRYTLQAKEQVDSTLYVIYNSQSLSPTEWIRKNLPKNAALAYDPWLHTERNVVALAENCAAAEGKLVALERNPIDHLWIDRPEPPLTAVRIHDITYAGESREAKITRIAAPLASNGIDYLLLTAPDSICWLLNIRGDDVPYTPFALCFALLGTDGQVMLFIDERKISDSVRSILAENVAIISLNRLEDYINTLGNKIIQLDSAMASSWFSDRLAQQAVTIIRASDPCQLAKACKNPVEIVGSRTAHINDGVAVSQFLCWLEAHNGHETITEISVAEKLLSFRNTRPGFTYPSFATISGYNSNGAIVHYHAEEHSNKQLKKEGILLLDSGGQYHQGTTDITRTIALGTPTAEQKDRFTRVLKGHINLAMAQFPVGTTGSQLDTIARYALWQEGLDYDHGTGHGVGSFLSVHEGPQRISKAPNTVALQPGMIISNEPGYYKEGEYGIRIENLVVVRESSHKGFLQCETLTCVPIDKKLIALQLLSEVEKNWLNQYHAWVYDTLAPLVDETVRVWLRSATEAC
jgi:Xaa-Pro aminopeptidase